jgi:hypothetical protein
VAFLPFLSLASAAAPMPQAQGTADVASPAIAASYRPGREADARVARIAFRLAVAGVARCSAPEPAFGLVLQHLSQFRPADRPGVIAAAGLDRGPGVIVVVPGGPADRAGIRPGDVLLSVAGDALPPDADSGAPFDPARAHARADAIDGMMKRAATAPFPVTLLRDGRTLAVYVARLPACPSRVLLARSDQHNAYADGRHVFLTTGLVARVRSDDELAFIIAHEMAHNILRHAALMRSDAVAHGIGRTFGQSGRTIRETEREADALGGELMIDAGFDPVAGAAVLERLGTDLGIALFATHDPAGRRIAAMRALAAARARP